jgi:hypothetical protein
LSFVFKQIKKALSFFRSTESAPSKKRLSKATRRGWEYTEKTRAGPGTDRQEKREKCMRWTGTVVAMILLATVVGLSACGLEEEKKAAPTPSGTAS